MDINLGLVSVATYLDHSAGGSGITWSHRVPLHPFAKNSSPLELKSVARQNTEALAMARLQTRGCKKLEKMFSSPDLSPPVKHETNPRKNLAER